MMNQSVNSLKLEKFLFSAPFRFNSLIVEGVIWLNWGKFSNKVENTVGKEEIACDEQFLLFAQCVVKILVLQINKKQGLVWERLNLNGV